MSYIVLPSSTREAMPTLFFLLKKAMAHIRLLFIYTFTSCHHQVLNAKPKVMVGIMDTYYMKQILTHQ